MAKKTNIRKTSSAASQHTPTAAEKRYWLVKSEPECFSIQDLAAQPQATTSWSGVRNYQARNFMRDDMHVGDDVLFYHSSASPPAVVGRATVAREAYPDSTAWNPKDDHYDAKASPANPIWQMVDIRLAEVFARPLEIGELRKLPALKEMELLKTGSRLSVQPVREREFKAVLELAERSARESKSTAGQASSGTRGRTKTTAGKKSKSKPVTRSASRRK